jgi:hypothetical protein
VTAPTVAEAGRELGRAFGAYWDALARELLPIMQAQARAAGDVALRLGRLFARYRAPLPGDERWDAALAFGLPPADRADGGRLLLGLDD